MLLDWPGVSDPQVSQALISAVDIAPTVFDADGIDTPEIVQGRSLRPVVSSSPSTSWRDTLVSEFHFHGAGSFYPTRAITDGRYKLIHRLPGRVGKPIITVDGDPSSRELADKLPADHPSHPLFEKLADPPQWEMFDLSADPYELNDLFGEATVAEHQRRLQKSLEAWQAETDDPFVDRAFRNDVAKRFQPQ